MGGGEGEKEGLSVGGGAGAGGQSKSSEPRASASAEIAAPREAESGSFEIGGSFKSAVSLPTVSTIARLSETEEAWMRVWMTAAMDQKT
jgi:hypothetical protein